MFDNIIEYIAGLIKGQLEEMLQEVIEKIIELLGEDDSVIQEGLESLTPLRRMFATKLIAFIEEVLQLVADEVLKEEEPAS